MGYLWSVVVILIRYTIILVILAMWQGCNPALQKHCYTAPWHTINPLHHYSSRYIFFIISIKFVLVFVNIGLTGLSRLTSFFLFNRSNFALRALNFNIRVLARSSNFFTRFCSLSMLSLCTAMMAFGLNFGCAEVT